MEVKSLEGSLAVMCDEFLSTVSILYCITATVCMALSVSNYHLVNMDNWTRHGYIQYY